MNFFYPPHHVIILVNMLLFCYLCFQHWYFIIKYLLTKNDYIFFRPINVLTAVLPMFYVLYVLSQVSFLQETHWILLVYCSITVHRGLTLLTFTILKSVPPIWASMLATVTMTGLFQAGPLLTSLRPIFTSTIEPLAGTAPHSLSK